MHSFRERPRPHPDRSSLEVRPGKIQVVLEETATEAVIGGRRGVMSVMAAECHGEFS